MKSLRRACKAAKKIVNVSVILTLLLEPVGSPGILMALAAEDTGAPVPAVEESVAAPAPEPVQEEKGAAPAEEEAAPAPEEEAAPESASTDAAADETSTETAADASEAPVAETLSEETVPATETPAPTETPEDPTATTEEETPTETPETPETTDTSVSTDTASETNGTDTADSALTDESAAAPEESPAPATEGTITPEAASTANLAVTDEATPEAASPQEDTICLSASVSENSASDWETDGDIATTKENVKLGVRYVYPLDKEVTVTFTCLPGDESLRAPLSIERIKTSDINLPDGTVAVSEYAYDITTDGMENGTFKYDVTFPKLTDTETEVSYIEQSADEVKGKELKNEEVKKVETDKVDSAIESITVSDLDHFTIFVATYSDAALTVQKSVYSQGETVYLKAGDLLSSHYYRFAIDPPGSSDLTYITNCQTGQTTLSASYALPPDAGISKNWSAEIHGFLTNQNCLDAPTSQPPHKASASQSFEVIETAIVLAAAGGGGNPSADLDQYANDSPAEWVNGNLVANKATYFEGDSVPYRLRFDNLSLSSHTVTIEWDTTKGDKHALDYLTSFDRTVGTADPCADVSGCGTSDTFAIPADPQVTGAGVTPVSGNFTLYGGTITGVSAYSYPDGTGFSGDKSASIAITFTAGQANPVLAWGGHISDRHDWGAGNSAVAVSGSPYHTRLIDLDGGGGNQDRSLSADAVIFPASITIVKQATPKGSASFPFTASPSPLANFSLVDDGTSANTRLFGNITDFQTYIIAESVPTGWTLNSIVCDVTSENGGSQTVSNPSVSISLNEGENVTCTFSNEQQAAHLIVIKHVINDNGGAAAASAFTMNVTGGSATPASFPGAESPGTDVTLDPGSYSVSETGPSGYAASYSADCTGSISAGQTKTCTVTNNDQAATLIVKKVLPNNNGGTATPSQFSFSVNGGSTAAFEADGENSLTVPAGTYSVVETNPMTGYAVSYDNCTDVNIPNGGTATCTITNDDQSGTLIIRKVVVNDNGGVATADDFSFQVNGGTAVSFEADGENQLTVNAGAYTITEPAVAGYTSAYDNCSQTAVTNGGNTVCTITNNDNAPALTLVKSVSNDNGGTAAASDWTLTATGPTSFSGPGPSVSSGSSFDAGTYALTESGPDGYSSGPSNWVCIGGAQQVGSNSVTLQLGESATCTIVNDDIAPSLTLIKHVTNNNGGNAVATDWTLTAAGPTPISGAGGAASGSDFDAGTYALSESSGPLGYSASAWSCVKNNGQPETGSSVNVGLGDTAVCTIVNDDVAPTITLIKNVINNNGGAADANDFGLTVGGTPVTSGQVLAVSANTPLALNEAGLSGYSFVSITGDAECPAALNGTVTLDEGENVTCTITNDDQAGTLIVKKTLINDNGGNANVTDFSFKVNSGSSVFFEGDAQNDISVSAGTYSVAEDPASGYATTYDNCTDVAIPNGGSATCTITNNDVAPTITLNKIVINDNGGEAGIDDFGLSIGGTAVTSGQTLAVNANQAYALNEAGLAGYSFVSLAGNAKCPAVLGGTATLDEGENIACTITNDDQTASLTVIKHVIADNGGTAVAGDFTMNVTGTNVSDTSFAGTENPGTTVTLDAGSYSVDEDAFSGYAKTLSTDCSGTIALGETKVCTVTNDDQPGTLIVKKAVINDNGGTTLADGFSFSVDGGTATAFESDGENDLTVDAGTYAVTEPVVTGYETSYDNCSDVAVLNGGSATCTITNNDIQPKLTVTKVVANDNGGNAVVSDFPLFVNGGSVTSGVQGGFDAGSYLASETGQPGYAGAISGDCDAQGNVTLSIGDVKSCTITNDDVAPKLTLVKTVVNDNGGTLQVADFPLFVNGNPVTSGAGNTLSANTLYTATETNQTGYAPSVWGGDCAADGTITLDEGDQKTCTITNDDTFGTVTVTKWNDRNGDGSQQEGEEVLSGWEILLTQNETVNTLATDVNGLASFAPVLPGEYVLSETIEGGWIQTNISCSNDEIIDEVQSLDNDNSHPVTVGSEEAVTCLVGNQLIPPVLNIEKSNNSVAAQAPGDAVTYTITVTAEGNDVLGATVTDLPPAGFVYRSGSAVATSNIRGDLAILPGLGLTHAYASPGVWSLGDMVQGETITLSYLADISSSQDAGLYDDLAWARGSSEVGTDDVLANSSEPTPFVGTDVEVALPASPVAVTLATTVERDVDTDTVRRVRRVLGASTVLPATGADPGILLLALALIFGGLWLVVFSRRRKNAPVNSSDETFMPKAFFLAVLTGSLLLSGGTASAAPLISVQIETPEAQVSDPDFKIGFVVLDIDNGTPAVTCEVNGGGGFANFPAAHIEYDAQPGGNSGNCVADATVMPADGTYAFRVTADSVQSDEVSVELISGTPGTPQNYARTAGSCTASFTTADDGLTAKVELYRSTSTSFVANASTFAEDIAIAPNTGGTIADPNADCGSGYFYAIRAVALSGLGSGFTGDTGVVVDSEHKKETKTVTRRIPGTTTTASGAIPVATSQVAGEETAAAPPTEEGTTGGQVLGAEKQIEEAGETSGFTDWLTSRAGIAWMVILLALAGLGLYYFLRKRSDEDQYEIK